MKLAAWLGLAAIAAGCASRSPPEPQQASGGTASGELIPGGIPLIATSPPVVFELVWDHVSDGLASAEGRTPGLTVPIAGSVADARDIVLKDRLAAMLAPELPDAAPFCVGTFVRSSLLVTAFHCVSGEQPRFLLQRALGDSPSDLVVLGDEHRWCPGRPGCRDDAPDMPDFALARVTSEPAPQGELPLVHIESGGALPQSVLVTFDGQRQPKVRPVCRAYLEDGAATVPSSPMNPGDVQHGDSGGPLIGVRRDGSLSLIGVVRSGEGNKWYFTPVPGFVDVPPSLEASPPIVQSLTVDSFAEIAQCSSH